MPSLSSREERVWLVLLIVVAGFVLSVFFHYCLGYYLNFPYPWNTFLFIPADHWRDFYNIFRPVQEGAPYSYKGSVYFPFTYVPLILLSPLRPRSALAIFLLIFVAGTFWFLYRHLDFLPRFQRLTAALLLACLSYPFLFSLDRANVECLLFIFLCLFFLGYERGAVKISVFFLACACAMKVYPGVFIILFIAHRQYKAIIGTGILTVLLSVLAAAILPGGVSGSIQGLTNNLEFFKHTYVLGDVGIGFNASYFGMIRVISHVFGWLSPARVESLLLPYTVLCLCAFALLAAYIMFCERTFWKRVALLCFAMILFPNLSADYKLIHILFPVTFFLASAQNDKRESLYAVLFGLLLVPKAFFWLKGDISIGVILNPLLMTAMILLIVQDGLSERGKAKHGEPLPVET